jgi:elongator complex protein 3
MALLRRLGFKLQAHYMVNLHGATPEGDVAGFRSLFGDPDFRPDELKLYPCALIESAELVGHWRRGEWRPYPEAELLEVVEACLEQVPEYCRLSRVIRDFSAHDIVTGSRTANLREVAENRIWLRGGRLRDIRSREIRDKACDVEALELIDRVYASSTGEEHFLELQTDDDRIAGFLRLSLPNGRAPLDELEGCALLREVHVYGASLGLGLRTNGHAQHRGLGRRLVNRALELARTAGYSRLAVISSVGTREYYRALGFEDGELYQSKVT